jgi:hypothetical protein
VEELVCYSRIFFMCQRTGYEAESFVEGKERYIEKENFKRYKHIKAIHGICQVWKSLFGN